ncbi:Holliday junction branch migration protein RuvA [Arcanobacterium pinnipediorum]|uniref:Holliday junction branch migration complex subunit RuvA n=1 Tax=Arcanobacterium pinnipediorum TaxID=1503041 RepID=A0ABY5AIX0_9ACTO|nr:Holliday junction branch migration protein RuvA [Arcanobacterium pinnipediorum]USR80162.1 Holliday junction branch migration protein RuvA [Arcanobacterium pinnipediorum]
MIASVRGDVVEIGTSAAVIDVGGIGVEVLATPKTLSTLRLGSEARIATTLIVREDSLTLYGFGDSDERDVFNIITGVSGIGPRTALAVLATLTPDQLREAVATKNEAALTRVSGIGKKGAQRMILELGNKLGPARHSSPVVGAEGQSAATNADVLQGLVNLGWSEREASPAIAEAMEAEPEASVAQLLRRSLQILGARR